MKRVYFLIISLVIISAGAATCMDTDMFAEKFLTCSPYTENSRSEMFGMEVSSSLQILGLRGDLCGFKSSISTPAGNANIECNFTQTQIEELLSAMSNNRTEIETAAIQGLDATPQIGENPAVIIFNKYFSDTSVCTVTN